MTWERLFDRASDFGVTAERLHERLAEGTTADDWTGEQRDAATAAGEGAEDDRSTSAQQEAEPTRVVADAGVLAADLLVGGPARESLDHLRRHSWMSLVASDHLLDATAALVAGLASEDLAADWRAHVAQRRVAVAHPAGDHPALASAYRGGATQLLTFDEELTTAAANAGVRPHLTVSIRPPDAFARLFDPASLHESVHDDSYPGPDRDPRG